MSKRDELPEFEDRDRDRIPDDADTAEAVKDVLDTFKTEPPTPEVKQNDIAVLVSLVYKFD